MDEESLQIRWLVVVAAVLCAAIIGYNVFFAPEITMVTAVQTDSAPSAVSGEAAHGPEEYVPDPAREKVNINTATAQELDLALEGIGPVIAGRIVRYREENGPFKNAEELKNVPGIGEKTFEKFRDGIVVE